jgi:hypothetical protein
MGAFDHVTILLSFVFALALTHLLSRVASLLLARERVRFSWLLSIAILNAVGLVYSNWLALWDMSVIKEWDLASITIMFAFSVVIYFVCAAAAPEPEVEGTIDMEMFYWRNHRLFYALIVLCMVLALAANVSFLKTPNPALFFEENAATLPFFVPCALALTVKAPWAQWAAGIGMLLLLVGFTIAFSNTLH